MVKRTAVAIAVGLLAFLGTAAGAGADVTVEKYVKSGGLGGLGASESTTVTRIKGLKQREASNVKMTGGLGGFLGKVAQDMGSDTITDVDKDVTWRLDHKRKAYTESRITAARDTFGEERKERREEDKSTVRVIRNEITVNETGEKKSINGFDCRRYVITWIVETEDTSTKERTTSNMTSDLWNTPETGPVKALKKEEADFNRAYMKKMGFDLSNAEVNRFGLSALSGIMGGDEESLNKSAKEMEAKLAKVQGYPIVSTVTWRTEGEGAAVQDENEDLPPGLGAILGTGGGKKASSGKAASGDKKSGGAVILDAYTEVKKIDAAAISDDQFQIPAGYKLVNR